MLRSYVLVSLLNETADLRTRGKPLPDQSMGLTVGDKGETDARRRLSSCAPPNFNLNAEDAKNDREDSRLLKRSRRIYVLHMYSELVPA